MTKAKRRTTSQNSVPPHVGRGSGLQSPHALLSGGYKKAHRTPSCSELARRSDVSIEKARDRLSKIKPKRLEAA